MELHTQTHLPMLRDLLAYRLGELRADVHAAEMARVDAVFTPDEVNDRKEVAEIHSRQITDDAQAARDLVELAQVQAALQRLDRGAYGDCADCSEPIPLQRLLAHPAAECCAACQAAREVTR